MGEEGNDVILVIKSVTVLYMVRTKKRKKMYLRAVYMYQVVKVDTDD